jgi:hypothetical protein
LNACRSRRDAHVEFWAQDYVDKYSLYLAGDSMQDGEKKLFELIWSVYQSAALHIQKYEELIK